MTTPLTMNDFPNPLKCSSHCHHSHHIQLLKWGLRQIPITKQLYFEPLLSCHFTHTRSTKYRHPHSHTQMSLIFPGNLLLHKVSFSLSSPGNPVKCRKPSPAGTVMFVDEPRPYSNVSTVESFNSNLQIGKQSAALGWWMVMIRPRSRCYKVMIWKNKLFKDKWNKII